MRGLAAGEVFGGYRIESVVGRGGMGIVYRATELSLQRVVALKVIAPHLVDDAQARARFVREARAAASIEHPHVVPVYAAGEERDVAFIAMRFVVGHDLRTLVRREGALAQERALRLVGQVAAALDAAHRAGFVHRDVKPGNVLVDTDDHAYLTDFGLITALGGDSTASSNGQWVGTPDFAAPEQIRGERADARVDVYALGGLLFFMLTGDVPFPAQGQDAKLWAQLTEPPPSLPAGAAAFDPVIRRALAKRPEQRFASAGDLARAAQAAPGGRAATEFGSVAVGDAAACGDGDTVRTPARRRGRAFAVAAVVVALAATAAAAVALGGGDAAGPRTRAVTPRASPPRPPIVARLPAGRRPNSVVLAGSRVWVGERFRPRLLAYDAVDPGHASRVAIPSGVAELAVSGNDVWAALWRGRAVARVDAGTGRVTGTPIALPDEPSALAAADGRLWVGLVASVREGPGTVLALDPASGATRWSAVLPGQADRLVRAGGALWALVSSPNQLLRLDPDTGVVEETIKLPGQHASDLASGSGKLWVSVREGDWLVRIDSRSGRRAAAPLAHSPAGLAVHGNTVAVAMYGASVVAGFDARNLRHRGDVRVPLNPYMVALDDGGAWVACAGAGRLVRIRAPAVARIR